MDKKEILIELIKKIQNIFPESLGFIELIEGGFMNDELIDSIIQNIDTAIKNTNDTFAKSKLQNIKDILDKVHKEEIQSQNQNKKELEEIENLINNL